MHALRHAAGREFHRAGHDLRITQAFMRHKSSSTTADEYLDLDTEDLIAGMKLAATRWAEQTDQAAK